VFSGVHVKISFYQVFSGVHVILKHYMNPTKILKLVKDKKIHEARAFNFTFRYIDDVLSIKSIVVPHVVNSESIVVPRVINSESQ
jgi:hypothetical protein